MCHTLHLLRYPIAFASRLVKIKKKNVIKYTLPVRKLKERQPQLAPNHCSKKTKTVLDSHCTVCKRTLFKKNLIIATNWLFKKVRYIIKIYTI